QEQRRGEGGDQSRERVHGLASRRRVEGIYRFHGATRTERFTTLRLGARRGLRCPGSRERAGGSATARGRTAGVRGRAQPLPREALRPAPALVERAGCERAG